MCGKSMLGSLYLSILLISCISFDFGSANSSGEEIEEIVPIRPTPLECCKNAGVPEFCLGLCIPADTMARQRNKFNACAKYDAIIDGCYDQIQETTDDKDGPTIYHGSPAIVRTQSKRQEPQRGIEIPKQAIIVPTTETPKDICGTSNPCQHGGTCINQDDPDNPYKCDCRIGYAGKNCQQESVIRAYWDEKSCGPDGKNYNWEWCGKKNSDCPLEKSTPYCEYGNGYRTEFLEDKKIDNCTYKYYAEYTCQGKSKDEIIGKWKVIWDGKEVPLGYTCGKYGDRNTIYNCKPNNSEIPIQIEWKNKVYNRYDDALGDGRGAITNNMLTWGYYSKWMPWERDE